MFFAAVFPSPIAKMTVAAASYPEIVRITTSTGQTVDVDGHSLEYHNSNALVGQAGWDILLSKTGTTTPAGRCLIMRLNAGGQTIIVVLLKATNLMSRTIDALNVRRFLDGEKPLLATADHQRRIRQSPNQAPSRARLASSYTKSMAVSARFPRTQ